MPSQGTIPSDCAQCGAFYLARASRPNLYCSRACFYAWQAAQGADLKSRLLEKGIREGECLLWTGGLDRGGYGQISVDNRTRRVHIVSYETSVGPIPEGRQVQHSCNVRHCFEPSHLSTGDHKRNAEYMAKCGRSLSGDRHPMRLHPEKVRRGDAHHARKTPEVMARGEQNGHAKLTESLVREIRAIRAESGDSSEKIAARLGLPRGTVSDVIFGKTWKHVV